jgi:hypothetical protein
MIEVVTEGLPLRLEDATTRKAAQGAQKNTKSVICR